MANTAPEPAGMQKSELKVHVRLARRAPVHIAFALGGDGKAIIMMDKQKQPRAILKDLKQQATDSRNHRYGAMSLDADDPKLARITVDKPAAGFARKLIKAFQGTGIKQIELMTEDGETVDSAKSEEDEADGDEREEAADASPLPKQASASTDASADDAETSGGAPQDQTADKSAAQDPAALTTELTQLVKRMMDAITADPSRKSGLMELAIDARAALKSNDLRQADAAVGLLRDALDGADASAPAAAGAKQGFQDPDSEPTTADGPTRDVGKLTDDLTGLVKRMMALIATDPSQKSQLAGFATSARTAIKGGDLQTADATMGQLRDALDAAEQPAADAAKSAAAATASVGADAVARYRKSRQVWLATRSKVDADIKKLGETILSIDHDGAFGDDLEQNFLSAIDPVLSTLDDSLADILTGAEKATSADEAAAHLDQARTTVGLYQQFVRSDDTIRQLDQNPFMPLAIAKTLNASLAALSAAIH